MPNGGFGVPQNGTRNRAASDRAGKVVKALLAQRCPVGRCPNSLASSDAGMPCARPSHGIWTITSDTVAIPGGTGRRLYVTRQIGDKPPEPSLHVTIEQRTHRFPSSPEISL